MELAPGDAALPAVDLALGAHVRPLAGGILVGRRNQGSSAAPGPLQVVGARVAAREGDFAVLAAVDCVELGVGEAEAHAVNGVKVIAEEVVEF